MIARRHCGSRSSEAISGMGEVVALLKLGSVGCVTLTMTHTEILSNKGTIAIRKIASIYLFRGVLKSNKKSAGRKSIRK